jgi:hypothetical protein
MVYGIYLSYYQNYTKESLKEFRLVLSLVDKNHKLILVNNGNMLIESGSNIVVVKGDNKNWEFSGWDRGLKWIKEINENDYIIFANDTFCQHRIWSIVEKTLFSRAFRKQIKKNITGIAGDVNTFGESFSIMKSSSTNWVSTYLFGMNGKMLMKLGGRLSINEYELDKLIEINSKGAIQWGSEISKNLSTYIEKWMDPDNVNGWYKANCSAETKERKIKAILNEKYLSAQCRSQGAYVVHYHERWMNLPLRLFRKIYKVFRRKK